MIVTITLKLAAESRGELIDTFGSQVRQYREHIETHRLHGTFGDPAKVEIRTLIMGGEWRDLPDIIIPAPEPQQPEEEISQP